MNNEIKGRVQAWLETQWYTYTPIHTERRIHVPVHEEDVKTDRVVSVVLKKDEENEEEKEQE